MENAVICKPNPKPYKNDICRASSLGILAGTHGNFFNMLDIHCVTTVLSIPKLNCASKKDSIMLLFPSLYIHTHIYILVVFIT